MMGALVLMRIGWRNLWRNPRGTLLTALALGLGLTLLLISLGLLDGSHDQMVDNGVRYGTGHVVIEPQGYQETGSQELLLSAQVASAAEEFLQSEAVKHLVRGVSPRLLASGLLSSAANADGVRIMGVIPDDERAVSLDSPADRRGKLSRPTANGRALSSARSWPASSHSRSGPRSCS